MTDETKYAPLKLENQMCFPLYAASRRIIRLYRPFLDEIGLTYTQYIVMMVLWEEGTANVKALGERLYLDSGTLTPLLKSLEAKGLVRRERSHQDERVLLVYPTEEGMALRERAVTVPKRMAACVKLPREDAMELCRLLHKLLEEEE